MVELLKNKYIPKYRTEKPGFLHNTFAPKSKCSKKVGWVEALVPKLILDFFYIFAPISSKIANLKSFVGFAPLGFNLQGII